MRQSDGGGQSVLQQRLLLQQDANTIISEANAAAVP
jgi:hypothetical protein